MNILVLDGQGRILSAGTVVGLLGGLGSPGFGLTERELREACPRLLCPRDVSCLGPWALMVRRDRFRAVGGFDPSLGQLGYADTLLVDVDTIEIVFKDIVLHTLEFDGGTCHLRFHLVYMLVLCHQELQCGIEESTTATGRVENSDFEQPLPILL